MYFTLEVKVLVGFGFNQQEPSEQMKSEKFYTCWLLKLILCRYIILCHIAIYPTIKVKKNGKNKKKETSLWSPSLEVPCQRKIAHILNRYL